MPVDTFAGQVPDTEPPHNARSCAHRKDTFELFLKDLDGTTRTFMVHSEMTVWDLKLAVQHRCGPGPDIMRLHFCGKTLTADDRTLQDYGIRAQCTIILVLRMSGC